MTTHVTPMIHVPDVRAADRADVVEPPHGTFYGTRELIIRDLNRFWITFGQSLT